MFKCELSTLVKFSDLATQLQRSVFGLKPLLVLFQFCVFSPGLSCFRSNRKTTMLVLIGNVQFHWQYRTATQSIPPLPSFCCGGVVREALLSVRVRTGRCPLGTERKNCVQGLWTLSRANGSRALLSGATVDFRRATAGNTWHRVFVNTTVVSSRNRLQFKRLQLGSSCNCLDGSRNCTLDAHELRVLKRQPPAG